MLGQATTPESRNARPSRLPARPAHPSRPLASNVVLTGVAKESRHVLTGSREGPGGGSQGPPQAAKASRQAYDKNATYRRFPFHLGQVGGPGGEQLSP